MAERLFIDHEDIENSPEQFNGFSSSSNSYIPGDIKYTDVNNDGLINSSDLTSLMIYILYQNESFSPIDLNFDLNIDVMDILMFSDFLNEMN